MIDINKLNGFLGVAISEKSYAEKKSKADQVLDFYERYLKSQEMLTNISFSQGNRKCLYFYKDDVQIILPREELQYDVRANFESIEYMRRKYTVVVKEVNREERLVVLSYKQAQDKAKPEVVAMIKEQMEAHGNFRTLARISYITSPEKGLCHVDILGIGLHGIITVKEWGLAFTADMRMVAKKDDIVEVLITEIVKGKDKEDLYICSRKKALGEDPWSGIEQKLPKTTTVIVKCIRKYESNFVGIIEGVSELSCYCFYPKPGTINSNTGQPLIINTGGVYSGYIAKVDEEKRILRVRILDEISREPEERDGTDKESDKEG